MVSNKSNLARILKLQISLNRGHFYVASLLTDKALYHKFRYWFFVFVFCFFEEKNKNRQKPHIFCIMSTKNC